MKILLKLIFFFGLITSLYANIDEYKSDVYYANGIMMNDTEKDAEKQWKKKIEKLFLNNHEVTDKIKNVKIAYNKSQWFDDDIYEAFEQVMSNEWGWKEFSDYFAIFLKIHGIQEFDNQHSIDLTKQVKAYKQSIKDGHGVIVIAHSQGNYFTNEAYDSLEDWMKDYFHMFGVATPANHVAGYAPNDATAPYVTFHNDFINSVITGLPSNRDNPNTEHNSVMSIAAHDFYNSYLTAANTKKEISDFIKNKLDDHVKSLSQWQTKEELNYGTKDYRIKVEHRFDKNVVVNDDVYPFAPSQKLYYVDVSQQSHISGYVKGSYGGEAILDARFHTWENKQKSQFYKLEGTEPPEYIIGNCPDPSLYEIISHQFAGTQNWRIGVMNIQTGSYIDYVYPFNLEGSVYQLDTGEWVMASCGGYEIESSWDGQEDYEYYKLKGTGEIINSKIFVSTAQKYIYNGNCTYLERKQDSLHSSKWQNWCGSREKSQAYLDARYQHIDDINCSHYITNVSEYPSAPSGAIFLKETIISEESYETEVSLSDGWQLYTNPLFISGSCRGGLFSSSHMVFEVDAYSFVGLYKYELSYKVYRLD